MARLFDNVFYLIFQGAVIGGLLFLATAPQDGGAAEPDPVALIEGAAQG
ncbi:MAG: hypothetical protein ACFBQW_01805 [Sphingomonadaceae bacterium]